MRALITGINGFVGKHLAEYLHSRGIEIWGIIRPESAGIQYKPYYKLVNVDLNKEEDIIKNVEMINPDHIYHLAGQSSVKDSWDQTLLTFDSNVRLTLNLLDSVRKSRCADKTKILTIGSSEEYGKIILSQMPICESVKLNPISPYGLSKATVFQIAQYYTVTYGMKIIHARPFNHIGPGQRLGFVVPDLAKQIVEIEQGAKTPVLLVGNLDSERDFTDVRDIVRAYYNLLSFDHVPFGEPVNICSGRATSIHFILELLLSYAKTRIEVSIDQSKLRPSDMPLFIGNCSKLASLTGWMPEIPIQKTLIDVLEYIRDHEK